MLNKSTVFKRLKSSFLASDQRLMKTVITRKFLVRRAFGFTLGMLLSGLSQQGLAGHSGNELMEELLQEEREETLLSRPIPNNTHQMVTMKSPGGDVERFSSKHSKFKQHRPDLPKIDIEKKEYLCQRTIRLSSEQKIDLVETQLEINAIISQLKAMPVPRELSVHQKVFLAQVPFCEQFITDLMIISKLLKGYTLVSLSSRKGL